MALIEKLTAIADAIRAKTGKSEKLTLDQMVEEVDSGLADKKYQDSFYALTKRGTDFSYAFAYRYDIEEFLYLLDTSSGITFESMFYGCSDLCTVPLLDTSNGTNFRTMFDGCEYLRTVPALDVSNGTDFYAMFRGCTENLTEIPALDVSNGTSFSYMFSECVMLKTVPALNTLNGTSFSNMFSGCTDLETIESINLSKAGYVSYMFENNWDLTNITIEGTIKATDIKLIDSSKLTHESIMSFINALVDNSETGVTKAIYFGTTNLAKLTEEELAIMESKNWEYS